MGFLCKAGIGYDADTSCAGDLGIAASDIRVLRRWGYEEADKRVVATSTASWRADLRGNCTAVTLGSGWDGHATLTEAVRFTRRYAYDN